MAEFTKTYTFNCPYCGNAKIVKNGKQAGKQRYRCKSCGKQFNDTGALGGRRATAEQIGAAVRMYFAGNSYKQTSEVMAQGHNMPEPSKETVYRWVAEQVETAKDIMADFPAHTSGKWVADEIQVNIGGEKMWLWNVMDAGTRYALAVHLSPNRDTRAAVAVMRKAMAAADNPPKSITTDKLGSYTSAIKQVFPDADHIQSEGLRARVNNNLSERLQGTIRDREKTLRALDGLETGQRYFDGWAINYNLFREHEGIKGQTPGEMAGVNPPFTEWADVVRVAATAERSPSVPEPTPDDNADSSVPSTTHFVPDPEARRRPKGETDEEPWPPSPVQIEEWRNVRPTAKERVAASAPKVRMVGPTRQGKPKRRQPVSPRMDSKGRAKPPKRKSPKATAGRLAKAR